MIAICSMVRNEARYLPEWLAFHRLQGVGLFRIYDDRSTDDTPAFLAQHPDVDLVPWGGQHFGRQADAFTDALQWLRGRTDWCAFIDADEFLFDPTSTLADELYRLPLAVSAIAVNQRVFGTSWHEHASAEPVTKRFTLRAKDDYHGHYWIKTIARPQATSGFNTQHGVVLSHGSYVLSDQTPFETRDHPGHATHIAKSGIRLHHYILKSREEYREKQMRGAVSDRADYKRHTDEFFRVLEKDTNAVLDETLLPFAERVTDALNLSAAMDDRARQRVLFDARHANGPIF